MTSLETLDLENNNLGFNTVLEGGMPSELVSLTRLQCLNLTQNKLNKIPDVVVKFGGLRILDLTNNRYLSSHFSCRTATHPLHLHVSAALTILSSLQSTFSNLICAACPK